MIPKGIEGDLCSYIFFDMAWQIEARGPELIMSDP